MRTVRVKACNLKSGDVFNGMRIQKKFRTANKKRVYVAFIKPRGNAFFLEDFRSEDFVIVKRPIRNMNR